MTSFTRDRHTLSHCPFVILHFAPGALSQCSVKETIGHVEAHAFADNFLNTGVLFTLMLSQIEHALPVPTNRSVTRLWCVTPVRGGESGCFEPRGLDGAAVAGVA